MAPGWMRIVLCLPHASVSISSLYKCDAVSCILDYVLWNAFNKNIRDVIFSYGQRLLPLLVGQQVKQLFVVNLDKRCQNSNLPWPWFKLCSWICSKFVARFSELSQKGRGSCQRRPWAEFYFNLGRTSCRSFHCQFVRRRGSSCCILLKFDWLYLWWSSRFHFACFSRRRPCRILIQCNAFHLIR